MNHIFLSYSRKDLEFMIRVRDYLREQQLPVWTDEKLIPGTPDWEVAIEEAISTAVCVVVILSPDSRASRWVGRELTKAEDEYKLPVFPILLRGDDAAVPLRLATTQRIDAKQDQDQALQELAAAIQRLIGVTGTAATTFTSPDDFSTSGQICVVAKEGYADYRTISEAIRKVRSGTRIMVRPGLYQEQLILDKPVEITGDGPQEDIIVETSASDCVWMQTHYAVIRGLTLRLRIEDQGGIFYAVDIPQGKLVLEDCDITSNSSSCIGIHGPAADPVVRSCHIHDSSVSGIFIYDYARAAIINCDVYDNQYSSIEVKSGADPRIVDCRIYDGKTCGILVFDKARGTILNCDIYGNVYAGIEIKTGGNPTIESCQYPRRLAGGHLCSRRWPRPDHQLRHSWKRLSSH